MSGAKSTDFRLIIGAVCAVRVVMHGEAVVSNSIGST